MEMPQIEGGFRAIVFIVGCRLLVRAFLREYFGTRQRLLTG